MIFIPKESPLPELLPPECQSDSECRDDQSCINQRCVNPCIHKDPCAPNAFCYVSEHRPVCRCPEGFIGDPKIECKLRKYNGALDQQFKNNKTLISSFLIGIFSLENQLFFINKSCFILT